MAPFKIEITEIGLPPHSSHSNAVLSHCSARPCLKIFEYAVHGFPWIVVSSFTAVFAYAYRWNTQVQYGVLVLNIGLLADLATVGTVKLLVRRPRPVQNIDDLVLGAPIADQYSFPSGHSSRATVLGVLLSYFVPWCVPLGVVLPLIVGYSRLAMGRHYVFDVLGGFVLGVAIGGLALLTPMALNRWMQRLFS